MDAGGRPIPSLEAGSTLHVGAQSLRPRTLYEFRATVDGRPVTFARATTDGAGQLGPFVLWYESGVVGCVTQPLDGPDPERFRFRSFDEAERVLGGRTLVVTAHPVVSTQDRVRRVPDFAVGEPESTLRLPIATRRSPMVFPADSSGCLVNALGVGRADLYVGGRNFTPGEQVEISVVPNQRAWYVNDVVLDVTGTSAAPAPEMATVGRGRTLRRPRLASHGAISGRVRHRGATARRQTQPARRKQSGLLWYLKRRSCSPLTIQSAGRTWTWLAGRWE